MMHWLFIALLVATVVYGQTPTKKKRPQPWKAEPTKAQKEKSLKEVGRLLRKIEKRSPELDKMKRALAGEGLPTPTPTPEPTIEDEIRELLED